MSGPTSVAQRPLPPSDLGGPTAPSPVRTDKVEEAANRIRELTHSDGFLGTDRNSHMHEVRRILSGDTGLSLQEINQVVSRLSDSDLRSIAGDIDSGGILGAQGLSSDEKKDLFNEMALSLDGRQLARISNAFGDRDDIISLGDSVGRFSNNDVKVGYVRAMAGRTTDQMRGDISAGFGYTNTKFSDPDAIAVGKAIAGLRGDPLAVDQAIGALNDQQLQAVLKSGAEQEMHTTSSMGGASVSGSWRADTLVGVLDAVASSRDADVKARVFAQAGRVLGDVAGSNSLFAPNPSADDQAARIRSSLQRVIDSDVTGVVRSLESNDRYGTALTNYVRETLKQGDAGQRTIGAEIAQLQRGNSLQGNPIERINAQTNDYYANAQSMGYFAGATQAAIAKIASDNKTQAELLGSIFKAAVGVASNGLTPVAGAAIGLYTDQAVKAAVDSVAAGTSSMRDTFYQLAFPRDPANGRPYEGPAERDYDSALNRVLAANP